MTEATMEDLEITSALTGWFATQDVSRGQATKIMCISVGILTAQAAKDWPDLIEGLTFMSEMINQTAVKAFKMKEEECSKKSS